MITDANRDPRRTGGIEIERLVVQADQDGKKKLILRTAFSGGLSIPVRCDVAAALDGQTVKLGRLWVVQKQNNQASCGRQLRSRIDALDSAIRYADIILAPNPATSRTAPRSRKYGARKSSSPPSPSSGWTWRESKKRKGRKSG